MKTKMLTHVILRFLVFLCVFPVFFYSIALGQDRIVENVTVTNIEVPVRVLFKGKPVTDLKKEDFTVYENNKKVEINGFFLKRKQINVGTPGEETGKILPLRTFVIAFSITDFNEHLDKAVTHLFENIFRGSDRLLILVNDKTLEYLNLENKGEVKKLLIAELKEESRKARERLQKYINMIETSLNVHDFRIKMSGQFDEPADRAIDFMKKYLLTWNDYKSQYLTPRLDNFYFFARYLEKLKTEKWVFNFYQFDLFPNIMLGSRTMNALRDLAGELSNSNNPTAYAMGKMLNTLVNQTMVDLNVNKGVPTEEIAKLFYKVDATFHSFFIRTSNPGGKEDIGVQEVASDIERTLKDITQVTGGETITSNDLVKSIDTVSEVEDAYYILTYAPADPKKAGKLKITVNDKKYKALYDDNFRVDYISEYLDKMNKTTQTPTIKIEGFSFNNKVLAFTIKDYAMGAIENVKAGRMKIRIRLTDANSKSLFNEEKILTAQKNEMAISLNTFKNIPGGEYFFLIDAVDMLTNKEANFNQNIMVKE